LAPLGRETVSSGVSASRALTTSVPAWMSPSTRRPFPAPAKVAGAGNGLRVLGDIQAGTLVVNARAELTPELTVSLPSGAKAAELKAELDRLVADGKRTAALFKQDEGAPAAELFGQLEAALNSVRVAQSEADVTVTARSDSSLLPAGLGLLLPALRKRWKPQRPTVRFRGEVRYLGPKLPVNGLAREYELDLYFYLQDDPEPLPLNPGAKVRLPGGVPEDNGAFRVSTYTMDDGLPEGRYKVTATLRKTTVRMATKVPSGPDLLGGRYGDPRKTPLEVTIKKGMGAVRLEVK
jgi:hypothetical protein